MRALCGAIIAAGSVIGLGLTALGIGTRYGPGGLAGDTKQYLVHLSQMDRPLVFILVFLTCMAIIGLGIALLGLAYHHHRREREHLWEKEHAGMHHPQQQQQQRTTV